MVTKKSYLYIPPQIRTPLLTRTLFMSQGYPDKVYSDEMSTILVSVLDWMARNVQVGLEESVIVESAPASYKRDYLKLYVYKPVH